MATVDSLDIKISAEANKANAAITTLSNKLDRLSVSLSGVNSRGLATLGAGVNKLTNAISNFSTNTKTADFSRISKNIKTLNSIDGSNLAKLSASLSSLSKGISLIGAVSFNAESLNVFTSSIRKIGNVSSGDGIANLSKLKNELSSFINGINAIPPLTFNASGLSGLISSISRLGGKNATQSVKNLPNITKYLKQFVVEMNGVGNISFNASGMGDLISAVSRLGGKASTQAITNIPLLADAMKDFMKTLSTAPKVSQNLIDMTNAMAKFAKTGSSGAKAANTLGTSIKTMGKKIAGVPNIIKSFNKNTINMSGRLRSLGKEFISLIGNVGGLYAAFEAIKKSISISSDLSEAQNVIDVSFGDFKEKIEDLSKTSIADFGMSELTAKQMAGRFQAMGTAMGFSQEKMSDMSVELTKLAGDMASFYNVEQDAVATSLQSVFTGETEPLRKYGLDLTQATLQEWALKNGLDANIQSMSQMEKTMLRYQYVTANTGAAQGDFLRTQDSWANQTRILKQNLEALAGVIGGTLINALKPFVKAMNVALGYITAFAKTVSNALGKIFGWTYEESGGGLTSDFEGAADASDSIADSTGTAANNIKKMQAGLRAFDELKTIEMPDMSDSGAGGGGSAGGLGGAGGGAAGDGKWTQGNSIIKQFESEIDSLYKLGQYIGDALSEAMESIDWDSIYEKARNFGSGLASFLNGLISPRLFENLGLTVAGAINTALHFLDSFGETFDWSNFGESLGTGLTSFLNGIDWNTALSAASNWGTGIAKALNKFISSKTFSSVGNAVAMALNTAIQFVLDLGMEFDFKNFGKSIATGLNTFIKKINWKNALSASKTWGKGVADALNSFISTTNWNDVGKTIANGINTAVLGIGTFLRTFDWKKAAEAIANTISSSFKSVNWSDFGRTLANALNAATSVIVTFVSKIKWSEVAKAIIKALGGFLKNVDYGDLAKTILTLLAAKIVINATAGIFKTAGEAIGNSIVSSVFTASGIQTFAGNFFKVLANSLWSAFTSSTIFATLSSIGSSIVSALGTSIAGLADVLVSPLGTASGILIGFAAGFEMTEVSVGTTADEIEFHFVDMAENVKAAILNTEETISKFEQSSSSIGSQFAYIEEIAQKYYELSQRYTDLTEEEKVMLETYYQIIKDNIPTTLLNIDNTTHAYLGTRDALDQVIERTKKYAIVQAAQESLKDNYKNLFNLQQELDKVAGSQKNAELALMHWDYAYQNADKTQKKLLERLKEVNFQTTELSAADQEQLKNMMQSNEELQVLVGLLDSSTLSYLSLTDKIQEATEKEQYLTEIIETDGKAWETNSGQAVKSIENTEEAHNKLKTNIQNNNKDIAAGSKTASSEFEKNYSSATENTYLATKKYKDNSVKSLDELKEYYKTSANDSKNSYTKSIDELSEYENNAFDVLGISIKNKSENAGASAGSSLFFKLQENTNNLPNALTAKMNILSSNMILQAENIGANAGLSLGQNIADGIAQKRNNILNTLSNIMSNVSFGMDIKAGAAGGIAGLTLIPQFATGGFPEDGLFMANHTEFIGRFSNGKTAVANNTQITEGISSAVQAGNQENNMLMRQEINLLQRQNDILMGILQKKFGISQNDIGKAARNYSREYFNRTGNSAYDF